MGFDFGVVTFLVIWKSMFTELYAAPTPTEYQNRCPFNKSAWEDRAATMKCRGNDVYHCLLAQDKVSVEELCSERSLVLRGHCPFFTDEGYIHWDPCNNSNDTACPNSSFISDEVYKYRVCFGKTDDFTVFENVKQSNEGLRSLEIAALVVVPIVLIVAAILVSYFRLGVCKKEQDETVAIGTNVLRTTSLLYVVGKLGNCVSTAGKEIASHFARKNQMSAKFLNYLALSNDFEFSENTVYFIDGWFGLWNDNSCEESEVMNSLNLLSQECKNAAHNTKFVIGMRTDVLKKYYTVFESKAVSFSHNQVFYLDSQSEQKERRIKKHLANVNRRCDISECQCKKIKVDQIMYVKEIGTHLALKLLELDHTLGPVMIDKDSGPLVAMKGHFKSLKLKDKDLFSGILYIVLNGFYDENNFRDDIAESFDIDKSCLKCERLGKYTKKIESTGSEGKKQHTLAPLWSSKISSDTALVTSAVVFWHNFLYISAFHACYEESDDKKKMLLHCNIDAILQLVRPVGDEISLTVSADLDSISTFYEKRIRGKEIEVHVKNHPLMVYLNEKQ